MRDPPAKRSWLEDLDIDSEMQETAIENARDPCAASSSAGRGGPGAPDKQFSQERLVPVFKPEPDLYRHLKVTNFAVDQVTADLRDLEPVEVSECGVGPRDAIADGLVDAVRRRPDNLGDAIRVIH